MTTAAQIKQIKENASKSVNAYLPRIGCLSLIRNVHEWSCEERADYRQNLGKIKSAIHSAERNTYAAMLADAGMTVDFAENVLAEAEAAYAAMSNEQKYAAEIAVLSEAMQYAINKTKIQNAINRIKLYGDAYGAHVDAAWYTGAKQYACRIIRKAGGKRYRKSGKSVAGSVYYELQNGRTIRISDHQLPQTEQRQYNSEMGIGGKWWQVVLDSAVPMAEVEAMLNEAIN